MIIGVISDTHGNLAGWERAWELGLSQADIIIHCGDLFYHGPKFTPVEAYSPKGLAEKMNAVEVPLLVAKGNGDSEVDQMVVDFPIQQPYLLTQIEGTRLLATHGHLMKLDKLVELCSQWKVDFLLTGHTHVPVIRHLGKVTHLNPGTPTYPLNEQESQRFPSFAVITDGVPEIIDLRTSERSGG